MLKTGQFEEKNGVNQMKIYNFRDFNEINKEKQKKIRHSLELNPGPPAS